MVAVGFAAALGMAAVGAQGYRGLPGGTDGAGLQAHVLFGLAAVLVFLLAHAWVAFYLLGAVRVLPVPLAPPLAGFGRRTLPLLAAAVAAGLATFVLGTAVHAGRVPAGLHGALLWATLALQAWAGWAEWRAVAAAEGAVRAAGA
jgi:hypothetical protein